MLDKLVPLIGKSIETEEIKEIFKSWNAQYPKRLFCTDLEPNVKAKVEKDCIRLYFGKGQKTKFLNPIPTSWEGGFVAILTHIEFTKKSRGGIPFDITFQMTPAELTHLLGDSVEVETDDKAKKQFWSRKVGDKHELLVEDVYSASNETNRTILLRLL